MGVLRKKKTSKGRPAAPPQADRLTGSKMSLTPSLESASLDLEDEEEEDGDGVNPINPLIDPIPDPNINLLVSLVVEPVESICQSTILDADLALSSENFPIPHVQCMHSTSRGTGCTQRRDLAR